MKNDNRARLQAMYNNVSGFGAFVAVNQAPTMAEEYQNNLLNDLTNGNGSYSTNQQLADNIVMTDTATGKVYQIGEVLDPEAIRKLKNLTKPVAISDVIDPNTKNPADVGLGAGGIEESTYVIKEADNGTTVKSVGDAITKAVSSTIQTLGGGIGGVKPSKTVDTPSTEASFWEKNKKKITLAGIILGAIALIVAVIWILRG